MASKTIYKANFDTIDKIENLQILADKACFLMGTLVHDNIETLTAENLVIHIESVSMVADVTWDYILKIRKELNNLFDNSEIIKGL